MPPSAFTYSVLKAYRIFVIKISTKAHIEDPTRKPVKNKILNVKSHKKKLEGYLGKDKWRQKLRNYKIMIASSLRKALDRSRDKAQRLSKLSSSSSIDDDKNIKKDIEMLCGYDNILRSVLLFILGTASKTFMKYMNHTNVEGSHYLSEVLSRHKGQPLITICNHVAALDDPLIVSAMVPSMKLIHKDELRWTMCATDRCFSNKFMTSFFRSVKVLPIERGAGLDQLGMKTAIYLLNKGNWVHIFPEGTRSKNGELLPLRPGIAKLIASCKTPPLVLPFVHSGMNDIMPLGTKIPKIGKNVKVLVGEPIRFEEIFLRAQKEDWSDEVLYNYVVDELSIHLAALWSKLENKPMPLLTKSLSPGRRGSSRSFSNDHNHDHICNKFLNKVDENLLIFNHHKYVMNTKSTTSWITNIFPILKNHNLNLSYNSMHNYNFNIFSLKNNLMILSKKWSQMTLDYMHYYTLKQEYLLLNNTLN